MCYIIISPLGKRQKHSNINIKIEDHVCNEYISCFKHYDFLIIEL